MTSQSTSVISRPSATGSTVTLSAALAWKMPTIARITPRPIRSGKASRCTASIRSPVLPPLQRRCGELVKINAIAKQDYESAITGAQQARSDVVGQAAALKSAQRDLARTATRAPIAGRIRRSVVTTGALVTAAQTDPLTTIQRLDPGYVDVPR